MNEITKENLQSDLSITAFVAVVVLILCIFIAPIGGIAFSVREDALKAETIITILAPAFLSALFIERAVEIFVVSLRKNNRQLLDSTLSKLDQKIKNLPALTANPTPRQTANLEQQLKELEGSKAAITEKIAIYKRGTTKLSSVFSLIFSFLIALIGIRLLSPFFTIEYSDCLSGLNITPEDCPSGLDNLRDFYVWFIRLDVFISTFVIAGGAAGMHSIIDAITSFADRTKQTNQTTQ